MESARVYYRILHKIYFSMFLIFFAAAFLNMVAARSVLSLVKLHVLLVLPAYFYFLRHKVSNLFLFILTHLMGGVVCLIYLVPAADYLGLAIALGLFAIYMLVSFAYKSKERENNVSYAEWLAILILLAAAYIASASENIRAAELVQPYTIGAALAITLIFFIGLHLENMDTTIHNVSDMIAHPIQKIRKFNSRILWFFLGITTMLVSLALVFHVENLIYAFGRMILAFTRWFFGLFQGDGEAEQEAEEIIQEVIEENTGGMMELPKGESSVFWKILEVIVIIAVVVGVIAAVGYAIYRFYRWFYAQKGHKVVVDQYEEISDFMEKSEYNPEIHRNPSILERIFLDSRGKVRRAYRKKVEKQIRDGKILLSDTPGQIDRQHKELDMQQLVRIYEKARYTQKEISKEDLRAVQ